MTVMNSQAWDERYAAAELVWSAQPNRFVVSELSELASGLAYDMATGEGRNAIWLAGRGWHVTAADFSAVALEKARVLASRAEVPASRIRWVRADVTVEAPEAATYDLVLVCYLQLPAAARRLALRAAARALRAGGTLLVIAHDSSNLTEGVGGPQDASVLYTAEDAGADLADLPQLEVKRAERVARPVIVDGVERIAWDAMLRLRRTNPAGRASPAC